MNKLLLVALVTSMVVRQPMDRSFMTRQRRGSLGPPARRCGYR